MPPRRGSPDLTGDRCSECNGSGDKLFDFIWGDCPTCNGTGLVNSPNACTKCKGKGTFVPEEFPIEMDCDHCNGSGLEPIEVEAT